MRALSGPPLTETRALSGPPLEHIPTGLGLHPETSQLATQFRANPFQIRRLHSHPVSSSPSVSSIPSGSTAAKGDDLFSQHSCCLPKARSLEPGARSPGSAQDRRPRTSPAPAPLTTLVAPGSSPREPTLGTGTQPPREARRPPSKALATRWGSSVGIHEGSSGLCPAPSLLPSGQHVRPQGASPTLHTLLSAKGLTTHTREERRQVGTQT